MWMSCLTLCTNAVEAQTLGFEAKTQSPSKLASLLETAGSHSASLGASCHADRDRKDSISTVTQEETTHRDQHFAQGVSVGAELALQHGVLPGLVRDHQPELCALDLPGQRHEIVGGREL